MDLIQLKVVEEFLKTSHDAAMQPAIVFVRRSVNHVEVPAEQSWPLAGSADIVELL